MPETLKDPAAVTQITCIEPQAGKQAEALAMMAARADFMARQPGFISITLHRSLDGRIVNYVQWESRELPHAAHQAPEFRREWDRFDDLTDGIDPHLYEIAHVKAGGA